MLPCGKNGLKRTQGSGPLDVTWVGTAVWGAYEPVGGPWYHNDRHLDQATAVPEQEGTAS
jgi:hypothetical protein